MTTGAPTPLVRLLHRFLCRIGIHERRLDGCRWHCIWCRP